MRLDGPTARYTAGGKQADVTRLIVAFFAILKKPPKMTKCKNILF
jgi:hypothetical protein